MTKKMSHLSKRNRGRPSNAEKCDLVDQLRQTDVSLQSNLNENTGSTEKMDITQKETNESLVEDMEKQDVQMDGQQKQEERAFNDCEADSFSLSNKKNDGQSAEIQQKDEHSNSEDGEQKFKVRKKKRRVYSKTKKNYKKILRKENENNQRMMKFCQFCEDSLDIKGIQVLIKKRFYFLKAPYKISDQLKDLFCVTQEKMEFDKSRPYVYLNELLKELTAHQCQTKIEQDRQTRLKNSLKRKRKDDNETKGNDEKDMPAVQKKKKIKPNKIKQKSLRKRHHPVRTSSRLANSSSKIENKPSTNIKESKTSKKTLETSDDVQINSAKKNSRRTFSFRRRHYVSCNPGGGKLLEKLYRTKDLKNDIVCTVCKSWINPDSNNVMLHPDLMVIMCKGCYDFFKSVVVKVDNHGNDKCCRWCGKDGRFARCDNCHNVFCHSCIQNNFGVFTFYHIIKGHWKCFICTDSLKEMQQFCKKINQEVDCLLEKGSGIEIDVAIDDALAVKDEDQPPEDDQSTEYLSTEALECMTTTAAFTEGQEEVTETSKNAVNLRENNSSMHSNSVSQSAQGLTSDFSYTENEYFTGVHEDPVISSDDEDLDSLSVRGIFGWATLDAFNLPCIFRKKQKLVAVRVVQKILWGKQKSSFIRELSEHPSPKSYYVTEAEANLLNEINTQHCGKQFGKSKKVFTTNDLIVELNWLEEFYSIKKSHVKNMKILRSRASKTPPASADSCEKEDSENDSVASRLSSLEKPVINQFNFHGTNISVKTYNKNVIVPAHENCQVISVNNQDDGHPVYISSNSPTSTTTSLKGHSVTSASPHKSHHHQYPQKSQPKTSSSTVISTQQPTCSVSVSTSISSEIDVDAETVQIDTDESEERGKKSTNQSTACIQYENVPAGGQNSSSQCVQFLDVVEKTIDSQFVVCSSEHSSATNAFHEENPMPVIASVQGSVTTDDLQSEDSQSDVIIIDDIVASPQVPIVISDSDEEADEKPTNSTDVFVERVPSLSSYEIVPFRGQKLACVIREERNYCLVEAVGRQYFSQYGINEILYGIENVLQIPLLTCSDEDEKVFITFYGMPVSKLENGKLISFKDLAEYFLQLSYMYSQS